MHIYITTNFEEAAVAVHSTLTEAHAASRLRGDKNSLRIELHDVPTDKDSIVALVAASLFGEPAWFSENILRTWVLTQRGGLMETTAEAA